MRRFSNWQLVLPLLLLFTFAPLAAQPATAPDPAPTTAPGASARKNPARESEIPITLGNSKARDSTAPGAARWPQVLIFLSLSAAAVWLVLRLLRRAQLGAGRNPQLFQHLGCQPLPGGGLLHLVLVDDRIYLLGSQQGRIQLLDTIDQAEKRDRIRLLAASQPASRKFASLLAGMRGGK